MYSTNEEDCAVAGGISINEDEYRIIDNVSIVKQNGKDAVKDKFIQRVKRSVFVSNDLDDDYECIVYDERFFLNFVKSNKCCFEPLLIPTMIHNFDEESWEKTRENIESNMNERIENIEEEFNKNSQTLSEAQKVIKCLDQGSVYDEETGACKKFEPFKDVIKELDVKKQETQAAANY